jgi:hypothetical protein
MHRLKKTTDKRAAIILAYLFLAVFCWTLLSSIITQEAAFCKFQNKGMDFEDCKAVYAEELQLAKQGKYK